ncbi:MAG: acetylxylan esterase [Acidobacteria bacterium]|nr:acetylxylan esterase [Acidobacteriota bacterium]
MNPPRFLLPALLILGGCSADRSAPQPEPSPARTGSGAPAFADAGNPVRALASSRRGPVRTFRILLEEDTEAGDRSLATYSHAGRGTPMPLIVLLPPLGGDSRELIYFTRYLAERGFACLRLERPEPLLDLAGGLDHTRAVLGREVVRVRRLLDWVASRPEVDPSRIGILGVSTGALSAAVAAGTDQRIRAAVLVLGGADLPRILLESEDRAVRRFRRALMDRLGWTPADLLREARVRLGEVDPLRYADALRADRLLLVEALFDRVIPAASRYELWSRAGRPRRLRLPVGHYSAILLAPLVRWHTYRFLEDRLAEASPAAGLTRRRAAVAPGAEGR